MAKKITVQILGGEVSSVDVEVGDDGITADELKEYLGRELGSSWRYSAILVDGVTADRLDGKIEGEHIVAALRQVAGAAMTPTAPETGTERTTSPQDEWIPTVCSGCVYGACATLAHVVNGVLVKIEGNPQAQHNMGRLCARGNSFIIDMYDPYRVKVPMKRTNPEKGLDVDPQFVEITWEEAMNTIVEKLKAIREEDPRQFFINRGVTDSGPGTFLFQEAFGAPAVHRWGGAASCGNAEHSISLWAHNALVSGYDPDYTELLVLQGTSAGFGTWLGGASGGVPRVADARVERGMKVVVIDPRCSEGANKANEWIPILPGTDLAFNLAVLHVMLHELNQYDVEFIKRHTNGPYLIRPDGYYMKDPDNPAKPLVWDAVAQEAKRFDDPQVQDVALEGTYEVNGEPCKPAFQLLRERVVPYTPEWAEPITTVPAATLRSFTTDFVRSAKIGASIKIDGIEFPYRPVAAIGYHGSQRHANGHLTCMTLRLMNAIMGNYDVPGGNRGQPVSIMPTMWEVPPPPDGMLEFVPYVDVKFPPDMDLHQVYPLCYESNACMTFTLAYPEVRERFKIPYTIKAMITTCTNPFNNMGDPRQTEKAMKAIDFVVSYALWIDDPSLLSDIVLPDTPGLQRLVPGSTPGMYRIGVQGPQLRQPVVKLLYSEKSFTEFLMDLADRMGFLTGEGGFLDLWNRQSIGKARGPQRLDINRRYSWEEVVDVTLKAQNGEEHGLEWFKKQGVKQNKIPTLQDYHWAPHFGRRFPIYFEPLLGFGAFLKDKMKEQIGVDWDISDYDPLPRWEPCPEHDDALWPPDFDLYLINYKTPANTNVVTTGNAWLGEIYESDPYFQRVWMNAEAGRKKGLRDGDKVWIESKIGKAQGRVKLSQAIHPQVVAVAGAQGSWATNPIAKKGINYASLIPFEFEHVNKMVATHDWCTRVKITRA